jgi:hypothetical protein
VPGQGVVARNLTLRSHFGAARHASALTTLYFALLHGSPVAGGVEPDGTGAYTRAPKTNDATLWGAIASSDTVIANGGSAGSIVWPSTTGLYSITTALDWWAIYDLSAGGVLWYWGQLQTPITVTGAGNVPRIPAGSLSLTQPE